jgi:hypothetical protein
MVTLFLFDFHLRIVQNLCFKRNILFISFGIENRF